MNENSGSESAISQGIRQEIEKVLAKKPLRVEDLTKIEGIARHGRQLLGAVSAKVISLTDNAARIFACNADDGSEEDESTPSPTAAVPFGPLATAPAAETFGVTAIREIIAAIPKVVGQRNESPSEIISAIAMAEARGMKKLAAQLKKKLGVEDDGPESPSIVGTFAPAVEAACCESATQEVKDLQHKVSKLEKKNATLEEASATWKKCFERSEEDRKRAERARDALIDGELKDVKEELARERAAKVKSEHGSYASSNKP